MMMNGAIVGISLVVVSVVLEYFDLRPAKMPPPVVCAVIAALITIGGGIMDLSLLVLAL